MIRIIENEIIFVNIYNNIIKIENKIIIIIINDKENI